MQGYRPDRVVKVLTTIVSIAYFGLMAGGAIALVLPPALKLLGGSNPEWSIGLEVPVRLRDADSSIPTAWGRAALELDEASASLRLPAGSLPWWLIGVVWVHVAVYVGLVLLAVHHLRRIFQRVSDGAPFDLQNAIRLRWLGLLLLGFAIYNGVARFITSLAVGEGASSEWIAVSNGLHFNAPLAFVALALVALAEIFRRGAELEDEQALVV